VLSLAKLIVANIYVQTWVFKIDDEFNGRGTAYLNLDHIKSLANLRKKQIPDQDQVIDFVIEQLNKYLHRKAVIPMKYLYNNWNEYIKSFCKVGGVIEASPNCLSNMMASPSIAFIIEPNGEI
jgi:IQ domain-containing protein H